MSVDVCLPHQRRKRLVRYAFLSGEISQYHPRTIDLYNHVISAVARLLGWGSPSAVAGLIVTIHINTVERRPSWARAHVAQKRQEVVGPLFAHPNAASAIVRVFRIGGVIASALRVIPRLQFRRGFAAHGVSVNQRPSAGSGYPLATTALLATAPHMVQPSGDFAPAIALEKPLSLGTLGTLQSNELSVSFPGNMKGTGHVG